LQSCSKKLKYYQSGAKFQYDHFTTRLNLPALHPTDLLTWRGSITSHLHNQTIQRVGHELTEPTAACRLEMQ